MRRLALLLAVATAGVMSAAPATAADTGGAFVLVRQNAMLYSAPRGDAAHIRIHDFGASELPGRLDWVMPMRLVSEERDGFVTVETPGPLSRQQHCYPGLEELEPFRLRFFVRPADLAPVTTGATRLVARDFSSPGPEWHRLPRGAAVTLHAGVALMDDGNGGVLAASDGFAMAAGAPAGPRAFRYLPSPLPERKSGDVSVRLGAGLEQLRPAVAGRKLSTNRGMTRVQIVEGCVEAEIAVPAGDVAPHEMQLTGAPSPRKAGFGWKIRAGAPVFWIDGSAAGTMATDAELRMPLARQGGRRCFRVAARTSWAIDRLPHDDYFLQLCIGDKDVTPPPPRPAPAPATGIAPIALARVEIEDLLIGGGAEATEGKELLLEYSGWLTDGRMFDSTKERGAFKVTLGARQVIPGWEQGLAGMRVGGARRLTIPPSLAYGQRGFGDAIPPGSTLVFQVRLLSAR